MNKPIIQGLITILLFFGSWFALAQFNWMKIFQVEQIRVNTEQNIGDLFWKVFKKSEMEIKNNYVVNSVDSIVTHICNTNKIDRSKLKIHIIKKNDINAFALPNRHVIICSGLILNSENQEELGGVICHEIAHVELNHVMKKLVKEIGFSVLISITTGNSGTEVIMETSKMLSSSAFDRNLEKIADIKAVDYLTNANLNPKHFADFFYRLSKTEDKAKQNKTLFSTHPDSKHRVNYIIEYSKNKQIKYKPILSNKTWCKIKVLLKDLK